MAKSRQKSPRRRKGTGRNGQVSRDPSDAAAQSARAVAGSGKQAAQASISAARTATTAGEHAMRSGADVIASTATAIGQLWQSGLEMTSHWAERSSRHVARGMSLSNERGQHATEQSSRNIDAIVQSGKTFADASQVTSRELSTFYQERLDRNLERIDAFMRMPQELLAAQSELFRDCLEGFLQSSRRIGEMSVLMADRATRTLTETMNQDGEQRRLPGGEGHRRFP
jgi:hypothetical protein